MKITKQQLKQIIKEEITKVLVETAQVPVPNVEDLLKKFKEDPSTYSDYYYIAQGETPEERGGGFPRWLNQEFAASMLAKMKSYILDNNLLKEFWLVDLGSDKEHPLDVIESYITPERVVSNINAFMSVLDEARDLEEIERRKGRIKK